MLVRAGGAATASQRPAAPRHLGVRPPPSRLSRSARARRPEGGGLHFPACPAGERRCSPGPGRGTQARSEPGGGAQAQRGAGRAGRAEGSAGQAAAPERVERSGVPGGGGGGGVEEEGGGGPGGAPPAGARPGPARAPAAAPPPIAPPLPGSSSSAAAMARPLVPSSQKALLLELKGLQEEPVEGFRVTLVDEGDLYNWEVAIFGPPNTYYEGGYFKVSPQPIRMPLPFSHGDPPLPLPRLSAVTRGYSVTPSQAPGVPENLNSDSPRVEAQNAVLFGWVLVYFTPGRSQPLVPPSSGPTRADPAFCCFPSPLPGRDKGLPRTSKHYCWGAPASEREEGREGGQRCGGRGLARLLLRF